VKPPVGDLVDAALPRLGRVALADGEQDKRGLIGLAVDVEDRAPLTVGLRDVVLYTASEPRPIAGFRIARAHVFTGTPPSPNFRIAGSIAARAALVARARSSARTFASTRSAKRDFPPLR
jgi:hypothetical protein